jgi:hypothetical protein
VGAAGLGHDVGARARAVARDHVAVVVEAFVLPEPGAVADAVRGAREPPDRRRLVGAGAGAGLVRDLREAERLGTGGRHS